MQESHHKALQEQVKAIMDQEKEANKKLQQARETHEVSGDVQWLLVTF